MSILEEISKLTQPVFDLPDLEDEDVDGTASKTLKSTPTEGVDVPPRRVRKAIDLSIDDSCKYGGTKVSRNDVFDEFSEMTGLGDQLKENGGEASSSDGEEDSIQESNGEPRFHFLQYSQHFLLYKVIPFQRDQRAERKFAHLGE
ncbi:hypothetical protein OSTOST_12206, partial [Ostertagia ostertagi]